MTLVISEIDKKELREQTLEIARQHKASWIELGQCLYTIYKDKLYKNWGFLAFETYCRKELGIKETTASKLIRSYAFLEREEPRILTSEFKEEQPPSGIPHYESVNLLRLARENKKIRTEDFAELRQAVLNAGKEPKEVRAQVKKVLSESEERSPAEVRRARRNTVIRRLVTFLGNVKKEVEAERLLPGYLLKQIADLSRKLEDQIEDNR